MMIVKWRTSKRNWGIVRVECESETPAYVVVDGEKMIKGKYQDYAYHDTWADAWSHLHTQASRMREAAQEDYDAVMRMLRWSPKEEAEGVKAAIVRSGLPEGES